MSSSKVPALSNNAETPDPAEKPVALADEQLDQVAAGLAPVVSIKPADLQQAASSAVEVATAVKPFIGVPPIIVGLLPPLTLPTF
jgi:hypothetical protein